MIAARELSWGIEQSQAGICASYLRVQFFFFRPTMSGRVYVYGPAGAQVPDEKGELQLKVPQELEVYRISSLLGRPSRQ